MTSLLPTIASDLLPILFFVAAAWLGFYKSERLRPIDEFTRLASAGRGPWIAAVVTLIAAWGVSQVRAPNPDIHDEFSYLLAADTFLSGRLTNPMHPEREFFASPHVLTEPTYQSKYLPLQGLSIALGKRLFGEPIVGVWLGMAFAAAALTWALEGAFPPGWALLGGLLPAFRFSFFKWDAVLSWAYWSTSFWGGGLGLLGGALLLGAAWRLLDSPTARDSLWFGVGAATLAAHRPYDGFVVTVVLLVVLLVHLTRARGFVGFFYVMLPSAVPVTLALAGIAVYSDAVVGDHMELPHVAYSRQHQQVGHFRFSPRHIPEILPEGRRGTFHREFGLARASRLDGSLVGYPLAGAQLQLGFFLGAALIPALALLVPSWRERRVWLPCLVAGAAIAAYSITSIGQIHPHYSAPYAPGLVFLVIGSLEKARDRSRLGRAYVQGVLVGCLLTFLTSVGFRAVLYPSRQDELPAARKAIERQLLERNGKDLIIVRYIPPDHFTGVEWVYNDADIDGSEIIWAHDRGQSENDRFVALYPDRNAWLLRIDSLTARELSPYPK